MVDKPSRMQTRQNVSHNLFHHLCERYEPKIDYVAMDQVCTWSQYQVDILLYDQYIYIMRIVTR